MLVIGLTGSIGMGKSTTAGFFREAGVPVHDADAAVHALYRGAAVSPVGAAFPGVVRDGVIDRPALSRAVLGAPEALKRLESIVHPLVRQEEERFLAGARHSGARAALLDIPLLLESGAANRVDVVVVASCDPAIQRQRVLARPGMTAEKLDAILARQMPDAEKRRHAHFVVDTGQGFDAARRQVRDILMTLAGVAGRRPLRST
jgi:dephospho-CoA kinase